MLNAFKKSKKGFTLVELMVVVVIIGILTAIAIPVFKNVDANAKKNACEATERTIQSAIQIYKADHNGADPANLAALIPAYIAEEPQCPFEADKTDTGDYTLDGCTGGPH
ncbi:MAG: type II secretion system protein [Clostridiaceae bacterium]|nr:type II secretion system protein [Clostridiaceae bacterium]